MRSIILVFVVFAAGILLGREFWPQSHTDPTHHFRFHRGKMPYIVAEKNATTQPHGNPHGRILPVAQPTPPARPATP